MTEPEARGFLKLWRKAREKEIKIVQRDPMRLTLDEWRSDPKLVKAARDALSHPNVRQMLDVLRNSHLALYVSAGGMSTEHRAELFSRAEGYGLALNNLEALAEFKAPVKSLEADFRPPDTES